jgi:tol-pal system protein YbgF
MRSIAAAAISLVMTVALAPAFAQAPRSAPEGGSARLDRIEEQLANLQGVVAAVETLAKNNSGGGYSPSAGGGANSDQVRQLSEQIAELTQRIARLEGRQGSNDNRSNDYQGTEPRTQTGYNTVPPAAGFENKEQLPPLGGEQAPADRYAARPAPSAPPQQTASAGSSLSQTRPYSADPAPTARPAPAAGTSARAVFDQGIASLKNREYSAAENYLQQVIDQYPADPLAAPAQFWLGEAAFSSGEFRTAADRFLKTFTSYPSSERAPEALLKLAISLRRLGENAAACDSFAELARRYPQAKTIMQRADTEKKRANCS